MKKLAFASLALVLVLTLLAAPAGAARADNTQPPSNTGQAQVDPNSPWAALIDKDGNLLPNVKDLGEVQVDDASWFPDTSTSVSGWFANLLSNTFTGRPYEAEFHAYQAPGGQVLLMPTDQTAFFMAMNPEESGYAQASTQGHIFNELQGNLSTETGLMLAVLQGNQAALDFIKSQQNARTSDSDASDTPAWLLAHPGYDEGTHPDQVADALRAGEKVETAPWWKGDVGQLISDLFNPDKIGAINLGGTLLAYNSCEDSPIGKTGVCLPPPHVTITCEGPTCNTPPKRPVGDCDHTPYAVPGAIHFTAQKLDPPNPLVVGQDPQSYGVSVRWNVRIEPTVLHYWKDEVTGQDEDGNDIHECVHHTQIYREGITWVTPSLSLSAESRAYDLNELAAYYPENYLRKPDWSFGATPGGHYEGNTFVWVFTQEHVQLNDPGTWLMQLTGFTSGTEVAAPRALPQSPENLENGGKFKVAVLVQSLVR